MTAIKGSLPPVPAFGLNQPQKSAPVFSGARTVPASDEVRFGNNGNNNRFSIDLTTKIQDAIGFVTANVKYFAAAGALALAIVGGKVGINAHANAIEQKDEAQATYFCEELKAQDLIDAARQLEVLFNRPSASADIIRDISHVPAPNRADVLAAYYALGNPGNINLEEFATLFDNYIRINHRATDAGFAEFLKEHGSQFGITSPDQQDQAVAAFKNYKTVLDPAIIGGGNLELPPACRNLVLVMKSQQALPAEGDEAGWSEMLTELNQTAKDYPRVDPALILAVQRVQGYNSGNVSNIARELNKFDDVNTALQQYARKINTDKALVSVGGPHTDERSAENNYRQFLKAYLDLIQQVGPYTPDAGAEY